MLKNINCQLVSQSQEKTQKEKMKICSFAPQVGSSHLAKYTYGPSPLNFSSSPTLFVLCICGRVWDWPTLSKDVPELFLSTPCSKAS